MSAPKFIYANDDGEVFTDELELILSLVSPASRISHPPIISLYRFDRVETTTSLLGKRLFNNSNEVYFERNWEWGEYITPRDVAKHYLDETHFTEFSVYKLVNKRKATVEVKFSNV